MKVNHINSYNFKKMERASREIEKDPTVFMKVGYKTSKPEFATVSDSRTIKTKINKISTIMYHLHWLN